MPSHSPRAPLPTKDQIALLPPFEGLDLGRIRLIDNDADAEAALRALIDLPVVGFDTESKPTFARGDIPDGPHLVQFATLEGGWLFQLNTPGCRRAVQALLASRSLVKAGFGLDNDRSQLARSLGGPVHSLLDVDGVLRRQGYPKSVGVKTAIALLFGQRFAKSKKIGTSNWAQPRLSESQQRYAANDAYGALRVYLALQAAEPLQPLKEAVEPPAARAPLPSREATARKPREPRQEPRTAPAAEPLPPPPPAAVKPPASALQVHRTVPVLPVHDLDKALRFYGEVLGFAVDGAHRPAGPEARDDAPRHARVSRAGCVLQLWEPADEDPAGCATVFFYCDGLVAFHAELIARGHAVMRPGVEQAPGGGDLMTVTDPFGNRLRFVQD
ncbi:glyoxalase superfamily protein [Paracidovorax wautersii]|uniref:3'-5' exonuclease n=1 Tax=Paracidovorax wautersii TaxID=1177982 RepID=A0A1I2A276_9BURK|nr:glyoxalase superfamily protein [Paracidovorax wautersii]SFE36820.1 3'-5' exonuclease [Paracidovorax wautersii]